MNMTQGQILDSAEALAQTVGYNAFSFRDLAERVGIRAASVHHHFPTKADLCLAMVRRHRERTKAAMAGIDSTERSPARKLRKYAGLFQSTIDDGNRMCLCGMLASDLETLPAEARAELQGAFDDHEAWLSGVLASGRASGDFRFDGSPSAAARALVAGLEGALLIARTFDDPGRFSAMAKHLLAGFAAPR